MRVDNCYKKIAFIVRTVYFPTARSLSLPGKWRLHDVRRIKDNTSKLRRARIFS